MWGYAAAYTGRGVVPAAPSWWRQHAECCCAMQPLHAGARQATLAASFGGTAGAEYAARVAAADDRTTHEQNLAANPGLQHAQIWRRARAGPAPPADDDLARAIGIAQRSLLGAHAGGDAAAAAAAAPPDADDPGTESDDPNSEAAAARTRSAPHGGVHAPFAFPTAKLLSVARLCGRAGGSTAENGGFAARAPMTMLSSARLVG